MPALLFVFLGIIWGSSFVLARYAMAHGASPAVYTFWHVMGPLILLGIAKRKLLIPSRKIFSAHFLFFFITAVLGITIPDFNKFFLAKYLPSGTLGVMINTMPLFIYPLAILWGEERFALRRCFGVVLGVWGVLLLITQGNLSSFLVWNRYALFALLSPFCYALCSVYIVKKRPPGCSSALLSLGMQSVAAILLLPLILISPSALYVNMTLPIILMMSLEILLTTVGYLLLFEILHRKGSVYYSLTDGVVALTSIGWGMLFFSEKITGLLLLSVLLILCGMGLIIKEINLKSLQSIFTFIKIKR